MGHRRNRESETKARRIHATDAEWQSVRGRAETAGRSMSAYVIEAALARPEHASRRVEVDAIRHLTVSHRVLSEIVESIAEHEPELDHLSVADALDRVAARLDSIAAAFAAGGVGRTRGR